MQRLLSAGLALLVAATAPSPNPTATISPRRSISQ